MRPHVPSILARKARRERGAIAAMIAIMLPVFLGMTGLVVDVGRIVHVKARLQNAADAAALAGAGDIRAGLLGRGSDPAVIAELFAWHNGVTAEGAACPPDGSASVFINDPGPTPNSWHVEVTQAVRPLFFPTFGSLCIHASAVAGVSVGLLDVVLSVDETASMTAADMQQLREAASAFVDQLAPSPGDTTSARIALAQFQGRACRAGRCSQDAHVLTNLTSDLNRLDKIINGPSSGCPSLPVQPPFVTSAGSATAYGCPLKVVGGSGTFVAGGIEVAFKPALWDLWEQSHGGREGAKKVLVVMTDGANNVNGMSESAANALTVAAANGARSGPDGVLESPPSAPDDVEVFTVGFFDRGESNFTSPQQCPSEERPLGGTAVDRMLIDASSSTPGSCDHYYPLSKRASLPDVFTQIAGRVLGVKLLD